MQSKLHIKKGDTVKIMAGDARGQQGKVVSVDRKSNRAIVEGANQVSKHSKPSAKNPQGGITKQDAPIHISNLMLVVDGKTTRTGRKLDEKSGSTVRYSKKSGEVIK
jgi:large subunit ribosomal protein L24